ncbi:hypothetical protein HYT17_00720 [Candidatus Microgenomates bacterium]|nr:hypothetical protein [Candidatus Microgenomates bacterium]
MAVKGQPECKFSYSSYLGQSGRALRNDCGFSTFALGRTVTENFQQAIINGEGRAKGAALFGCLLKNFVLWV